MPKKNMTTMVKNKENLKKTLAELRKTKKEKPGEFRKAKKSLRRISRRIKVTGMAEDKLKKPVPAVETKPATQAPAAAPAPVEKPAEPKA